MTNNRTDRYALIAVFPFAVFSFIWVDSVWVRTAASLAFICVLGLFLVLGQMKVPPGRHKAIIFGALTFGIVFYILSVFALERGGWDAFLLPFHMTLLSAFVILGVLQQMSRQKGSNQARDATE